MPRFYFHFHGGHERTDHIGLELSGIDEAREQAIVSSGDMLRNADAGFITGEHWQMYVADEAGKTVLRLIFSVETRHSGSEVA